MKTAHQEALIFWKALFWKNSMIGQKISTTRDVIDWKSRGNVCLQSTYDVYEGAAVTVSVPALGFARGITRLSSGLIAGSVHPHGTLD